MRSLLISITVFAASLPALVYAEAVATISVDFAKRTPTRSYVGFLHGVDENSPSYDLLKPLQIQYWRAANVRFSEDFEIQPVAYARMKAAAPQLKTQFLLSDIWAYAPHRRRNNGRWPFEDYAPWEAVVAGAVQATQKNKQAISYWEVWNEPAVPFFWGGTIEQFFETYARAYRVLRKQLGPDAPIAGPSFSGYHRELMQRFLDYCLANGLEVNILTWHHNRNFPSPEIVAQVADARADFVNAGQYRALRIREIHIDEYGGPQTKHSPGAMLGFLYYLEAAQPEVAAKSCWKDSKQLNECYNGSLDGLVEVETMRPRAVWWAYKLYADGVASRVKSATSDPTVVALASRSSSISGQTQVLVARSDKTAGTPKPVDVLLGNLRTLPAIKRTAKLTISRLAASGEAPSNGPEVVQELVLPVSEAASIRIPAVGIDEVYQLEIAPYHSDQR